MHTPTPLSPPDSLRPASGNPAGRGFPFSANNNRGNEVNVVSDVRPGSAPTTVMQRFRPNPNFPSTMSASYSSRGTSAMRRSTHSAVAASAPSVSSYSLWAPRDQLTTETVTGSLALEVELLREKLQRQSDIAMRAEAALMQMAMSTKVRVLGCVGPCHHAELP